MIPAPVQIHEDMYWHNYRQDMEGQESQRQEMAAEQLKSQQQAAMQAAVPPASNAGTANGEASHKSPPSNNLSPTSEGLLCSSCPPAGRQPCHSGFTHFPKQMLPLAGSSMSLTHNSNFAFHHFNAI